MVVGEGSKRPVEANNQSCNGARTLVPDYTRSALTAEACHGCCTDYKIIDRLACDGNR